MHILSGIGAGAVTVSCSFCMPAAISPMGQLPPEGMSLVDADVAYLVGKGGATRARLENFSGANLVIDRDSAEIRGTDEQRALVKLAINITLQQREGGAITVNFDTVEDRPDVSTMDVPVPTVGFLLGSKGSTLRDIETRHHTFMFFDNERIREGKAGACKRLYVIGRDHDRQSALDEAEDINVRRVPVLRLKETLDEMIEQEGCVPIMGLYTLAVGLEQSRVLQS